MKFFYEIEIHQNSFNFPCSKWSLHHASTIRNVLNWSITSFNGGKKEKEGKMIRWGFFMVGTELACRLLVKVAEVNVCPPRHLLRGGNHQCSDPLSPRSNITISVTITVVTSRSTMNNPSPLSLLLVLLLAVSLPPASAVAVRVFDVVGLPSSHIQCVDGVVYAANSTFDANRRRLAGLLKAEAAARGGPYYTERAAGYWPFRAQASFFCARRGAGSCAACLADAFLELERACPYHKGASFYSRRNCTLQLGEYRFLGTTAVYGEFCHVPSTKLPLPVLI
jgi:hypothetical protein